MSRPDKSPCSVGKPALLLACTVGVLGLAPSAPAQAQVVVERVVAVVNGEAIYLSELRRRSYPFLRHAQREPTEAGRRAAIDRLYAETLDRMIDEALLIQWANPNVSDAEVDRAIENVTRQSGLSRAEFFREALRQGFTPNAYREDVRRTLMRISAFENEPRPPDSLMAELRSRARIDIRL